MSARRPALSIGLPVYNGARFVREALDGIVGQEYEDFELILSDNASTDGTYELLSDYARRDPRLRLFRQSENRGAHQNFRFVLDTAVGDFFRWHAYDDRIRPGFLRRCVERLLHNPQAATAYTATVLIDESGLPIAHLPMLSRKTEGADALSRARAAFLAPVTAPAFYGLHRRQALERVMSIPNTPWSDKVLLLRLALIAPLLRVPETLLEFRQVMHDESADHDGAAMRMRRTAGFIVPRFSSLEFLRGHMVAQAERYQHGGYLMDDDHGDVYGCLEREIRRALAELSDLTDADSVTQDWSRALVVDQATDLGYVVSCILDRPCSWSRDAVDLGRLLRRKPGLVANRMWWGALRRVITRGPSRA